MSKLNLVAVLVLGFAACATAPKGPAAQQSLQNSAQNAVAAMQQRDPSLRDVLSRAYAYAVFPEVGQAGALIAGGAHGRGILYQQGRPVGFVELTQGSIGPQLGGQTYSELLVLNTPDAVQRLKSGTFDVGAQASAVIIKSGAAASASFNNDIAVFVMPRGGAMAGISLMGQQINFQPMG